MCLTHVRLLFCHMKRMSSAFAAYSLSRNHRKVFDHVQRRRGSLVRVFFSSACNGHDPLIFQLFSLYESFSCLYTPILLFTTTGTTLDFVKLLSPFISPSIYHRSHPRSFCAAHVSISLKMQPPLSVIHMKPPGPPLTELSYKDFNG